MRTNLRVLFVFVERIIKFINISVFNAYLTKRHDLRVGVVTIHVRNDAVLSHHAISILFTSLTKKRKEKTPTNAQQLINTIAGSKLPFRTK